VFLTMGLVFSHTIPRVHGRPHGKVGKKIVGCRYL
jgi:hypothetical protein